MTVSKASSRRSSFCPGRQRGSDLLPVYPARPTAARDGFCSRSPATPECGIRRRERLNAQEPPSRLPGCGTPRRFRSGQGSGIHTPSADSAFGLLAKPARLPLGEASQLPEACCTGWKRAPASRDLGCISDKRADGRQALTLYLGRVSSARARFQPRAAGLHEGRVAHLAPTGLAGGAAPAARDPPGGASCGEGPLGGRERQRRKGKPPEGERTQAGDGAEHSKATRSSSNDIHNHDE